MNIKLSEFRSMSDEEKNRRVGEMFHEAMNPSIESLINLDNQIMSFESKYSMTSDRMKRRLADEEIAETSDICTWLMLLKIRKEYENLSNKGESTI